MTTNRMLLLSGAALALMMTAATPAFAKDACDAMMADDAMHDDAMMGDDAMHDDAMGDDAMADDAMGDDAMADDAMGDDAMADDAMGDDAMHDDAMADDAMADDAMGDDAMGDDAMGDDAMGMMGEYVVQAGDSLWSIAESQLCDGDRFHEIVDANADMIGPDMMLQPGQVLHIPGD